MKQTILVVYLLLTVLFFGCSSSSSVKLQEPVTVVVQERSIIREQRHPATYFNETPFMYQAILHQVSSADKLIVSAYTLTELYNKLELENLDYSIKNGSWVEIYWR